MSENEIFVSDEGYDADDALAQEEYDEMTNSENDINAGGDTDADYNVIDIESVRNMSKSYHDNDYDNFKEYLAELIMTAASRGSYICNLDKEESFEGFTMKEWFENENGKIKTELEEDGFSVNTSGVYYISISWGD